MISNLEYQRIAEAYGTPCFVYDLNRAAEQMKLIRQVVPSEIELCFAIKANTFLTSFFAQKLERIEVCSPGELLVCKKQNVDAKKIVFSGVNKELKGVTEAIEYGTGLLTIESRKHADLIEQAAAEQNKYVEVIVRMSSGGQFGVDRNEVIHLFSERENYPHLKMIGVHYFTGTQKKKKSEIEQELQRVHQLCHDITTETGAEIQHVEYGPGIGVSYYAADKDGSFDGIELLKELSDSFRQISAEYRLTLEMGRLFAADCGSYLTSVNDVKTSDGVNFCIIDGGINNINYYGQMMGMKQPPIIHLPHREGENRVYTVCGSLCTFQDVLIRKYESFPIKIGDLFVFQKIGAYSATEGINLFLSRDLPQVLLYDDSGVQVKRGVFHTADLNG